MAYETGTYTSPNNLVTTIASFLESNGWTVDRNTLETTGGNWRRLHVHKGEVYVHLRAVTTDSTGTILRNANAPFQAVAGYASDGFNTSNAWESQPGNSVANSNKGGYLAELNQPGVYHMFAYPDTDEIYIVVEYNAGYFQLMAWGTLDKFDTTEPKGMWFFATGWPGYNGSTSANGGECVPFRNSSVAGYCRDTTLIRLQNALVDGWVTATDTSIPCSSTERDEWMVAACSNSVYGWQSTAFPITVYLRVASGLAPYGEIKYLRRVGIASFAAGDEYVLGVDTWKTFPYWAKGIASQGHNNMGYAIKKVG